MIITCRDCGQAMTTTGLVRKDGMVKWWCSRCGWNTCRTPNRQRSTWARSKAFQPIERRNSKRNILRRMGYDPDNLTCDNTGCNRPISYGNQAIRNGKARAVMDHDHSCCPDHAGGHLLPGCDNCRRGVLCEHCNIALGMMHDDADRAEGLAAYLREKQWPGKQHAAHTTILAGEPPAPASSNAPASVTSAEQTAPTQSTIW